MQWGFVCILGEEHAARKQNHGFEISERKRSDGDSQ